MKRLAIDKHKFSMGTSAWAEQFQQALAVDPDGEDDSPSLSGTQLPAP